MYEDGLFTGESIVLVHQISFIMSVDKPYLPQLCSPADPKVAPKLFGINSLDIDDVYLGLLEYSGTAI